MQRKRGAGAYRIAVVRSESQETARQGRFHVGTFSRQECGPWEARRGGAAQRFSSSPSATSETPAAKRSRAWPTRSTATGPARCVATSALGHISGPEAAKVLEGALGRTKDRVRAAVADGGLVCAEELLASGQRDRALAVYNTLTATDIPKPVLLAAMPGIIGAETSLKPSAVRADSRRGILFRTHQRRLHPWCSRYPRSRPASIGTIRSPYGSTAQVRTPATMTTE